MSIIKIKKDLSGSFASVTGINIEPLPVNSYVCDITILTDHVTIYSPDRPVNGSNAKPISNVHFSNFLLSDGSTPATSQELKDDIDLQLVNENGETNNVSTIASITTNGGYPDSDYGSIMHINNNATEYYGCEQLLQAGRYDKVEIAYRNANFTAGDARLYVIILDKDLNTLSYKRLDLSSIPSSEGAFTIQLDNDVVVETGGVYTVIIGRRGWSSSARRCEIANKDANSSLGKIWIAYSSNNAALNTIDTSLVDWATISKQSHNRVPYALIYKY